MLRRQPGLTLIELLVVVGIVALLLLLTLPAVQAAREAARKAACQNNLRQIGIALHSHHNTYGQLPAGWVADSPYGQPGWGWAAALLPFLEEKFVPMQAVLMDQLPDEPYAEVDEELLWPGGRPPWAGGPPPWAGGPPPWAGSAPGIATQLQVVPISAPPAQPIREAAVPVYLCPSDPAPRLFMLIEADSGIALMSAGDEPGSPNEDAAGPPLFPVARANYSGVFGAAAIQNDPSNGDGTFYHNSQTRLDDLRDGISNTVIVGERASRLGSVTWVGSVGQARRPLARVVGRAERVPNDPLGHFEDFGSHHVAGAHFLFGDGGVRLLSQAIDVDVYRAMATRAGGEVVAPHGFVQQPPPIAPVVYGSLY